MRGVCSADTRDCGEWKQACVACGSIPLPGKLDTEPLEGIEPLECLQAKVPDSQPSLNPSTSD